MPKKLNLQTLSFILLFSLAVIGTYLSFMLTRNNGKPGEPYGYGYKAIFYNNTKSQSPTFGPSVLSASALPESDKITEDTTGWKTYSNETLGLTFKYNPHWKVSDPSKSGEYNVITIDPGAKYYNIKVYIGPDDYFNLAALPSIHENINGLDALNSGNLLFGLSKGNLFYTFNLGYSLSLKPDFLALVHSVEIQ